MADASPSNSSAQLHLPTTGGQHTCLHIHLFNKYLFTACRVIGLS